MKTLKDFTPEIQAKIPSYQKRATEGVFNGDRYKNFDLEKAKAAVNWNYQKCGLKPPVVLVAENPLEQQYLFNYLKLNKKRFEKIIYVLNNEHITLRIADTECKISSYFILFFDFESQLRSQLESQLRSQLESQLSSQLDSQLSSQLDSQLYSQLESQLDSQLDSQLSSQLSSQLDSQLESQLYSQLYSQLDSQLYSINLKELSQHHNNYLFTLNVYSDVLYAWYEFIRLEFDLDLTVNDDFQEGFRLQRESGIYSAIFSDAVCVVCKYPKSVSQEPEQFRLNSVDGPSVNWGGIDFDCYYVNGLNISKDLFEKLSNKDYTFDDFIKEENEEIKSAALSFYQQKFGDEFLFEFLSKNLKEIDSYVDNKDKKYLEGTTGGMNIGVYTLFSGEVNDEKISYVRCYCPSTDRMFFLGVDPIHKTAKDAIASLYRIPSKLKNEIETINRQGERFSTTFTEKGYKILESMDKKDIENLTNINGSEYFKLIKYEF